METEGSGKSIHRGTQQEEHGAQGTGIRWVCVEDRGEEKLSGQKQGKTTDLGRPSSRARSDPLTAPGLLLLLLLLLSFLLLLLLPPLLILLLPLVRLGRRGRSSFFLWERVDLGLLQKTRNHTVFCCQPNTHTHTHTHCDEPRRKRREGPANPEVSWLEHRLCSCGARVCVVLGCCFIGFFFLPFCVLRRRWTNIEHQ